MKYERLTKETVGSFGYDLKDFEHKPKEFNDYDAFYAYKMAVKRLGELEDKIESGEIDYVADRDKEIARLTSENASLRARLEKAVELPCKIGDEVYEVHGKCDRKNCVYNGYYGQWRCDYGGKTNCNPFITVNKFRYCDIPRVGKTIFVTKKAAEAV